MALSYDDWKNQWEGMTDVQRARVSQSMKDNATFQDYGKRYVQEQKGMNINPTGYQNNTQNAGSTVSDNSNGGINNTEGTNNTPTVETSQNETNETEPTEGTQGDGKIYGKTEFDPEETLQEDKFGQDPGKITIYEGTGKDTGRPDYTINTDERLKEMAGNLDHYYATQPTLFNDRKTFNEFFQYNDRPSDEQRALLDSYWKKAQDHNKAVSYTSGDALAADLNSGNMTQDVWNQVMEGNQKAYIEWQERMKNELELAIANFAAPFNPDTLADTLQSLVNKLGIQAGDPYDIIGGWENKMQELGAYQSLHELDSTVNQLKSVASQRQNIINRYASSAGGTQSDALVAARLNKALAPYDQQFSDLYTLYQTQHTTYQTKLGTANQYAHVMYQQAQEDQRIFNNKIKSLGFAMEVNSYRTPEQQAQLGLQVQSIQNDMSLLNQAKQNDLALYNQRQQNELNLEYEAKEFRLQNQLQNELTDLSVTDPTQLRANLNNVLSQYYAKFGDIIKRSQSQAVDDILAYAKANGVSVAEALTKNFIEPLQSKSEYKNMLATNYADPNLKYQDSWNAVYDSDGNFKVTYSGYGNPPEDLLSKNRGTRVQGMTEYANQIGNPQDYAMMLSQAIPDDTTTGQCGAFVNDYLKSLGDAGHFDNKLSDKLKLKNREAGEEPIIGSIVIMDTGAKLSDGTPAGHVGIVTGVDANGMIEVTDSNWGSNEKKRTHKIAPDSKILGYYVPDSINKANQGFYNNTATTTDNKDPYSGIIGYTSTGAEINTGGWIDSLEDQYGKKWASNDERNSTLEAYGLTVKEYNEQKRKYAEYIGNQKATEALIESYEKAKELMEWEKKYNTGWGNKHTGFFDTASSTPDENGNIAGKWGFVTRAADGKALYDYFQNNELLTKFLQLKDSGATFGAMQKAEWDLIGSSVNSLKWTTKKDTFQTTLQGIIDKYEQELNKIAPEYMAQQGGGVSDITKQYRPGVQTIDSITGAGSNQGFDLSGTILNIANM